MSIDSEKCQLTVKIVRCEHFSLSKIDSENGTPQNLGSVGTFGTLKLSAQIKKLNKSDFNQNTFGLKKI